MKCDRCGYEMDGNGVCGNCGAQASRVRVMSREEQASYDGITIEENPDGNARDESGFYRRNRSGGRSIFFRHITLGSGSRGWLGWVLGGILAAAVLGFLFFVALPVVLVLVAVAAVVWFLLGFFQGL